MARKLTIAMTSTILCLLVLPATGLGAEQCYRSDAELGELKFSGVAEGNAFQGNFGEFEVEICLKDHDLTTARIEVRVQTGSASVGNRQGDEALLGEELLFPDSYPEATWTSSDIARTDDGHRAEGEMRLRGISASQPVNLRLERDNDTLILVGDAEILRLEYEVGHGEFADPEFIDNRVDLEFSLELAPDS